VIRAPMPDGRTIPGLILTVGRIKTLKAFFQVTLAQLNTSSPPPEGPGFVLSQVQSRIVLPAGLTAVAAALGTNIADVNAQGQSSSVVLGNIPPGSTGTAQFIIRGDGIGTHRLDVDFDGFITGGGIPDPLPFS